MRVSIIVPVLNEEAIIRPFLERLRERAPGAEVVVVDGGSTDKTREAGRDLCDRMITAACGRAVQMNAGAEVAHGDVFWFVHADSDVPEHCIDEIERALADPQTVGGCFRIRFPRPGLIYRVSDSVGNIGVDLLRRSYGDHGIFCRRGDFLAVGCYPEVPIMEDAELYRLLGKRGRMRQIRREIITSPRRYERIGPYRLTAAFVLISALWVLRIHVSLLARIHQRLCMCPGGEPGR
jgi:rSAM/selenodomain-associated transferase 2